MHTSQIRSGSYQIRAETCILLKKSIHFTLHTEVNLKNRLCAPAKSPKVLDGRSCIFQKKYAFRSSVVTSMCAPPVENTHFFQKSADLPSKTLTFLSRRCQIRSGSSQITSETCILLRKCIHFAPHTEVNLKNRLCPFAKRHKVLDGRSCIFQKKYVFRSSVVTSMCAPPVENTHFFQKKYAFRRSVVTSMCAPPMQNHCLF